MGKLRLRQADELSKVGLPGDVRARFAARGFRCYHHIWVKMLRIWGCFIRVEHSVNTGGRKVLGRLPVTGNRHLL